ncbi:MAG: helix-turn-helix domain-containing protein [Chloroflexota bacterium]
MAHCFLLEGHRDDCYFATWSAHGVEGHTWEVLDILSQNDALIFADLHSKLSKRGVTEEVHAGDMRELIRRGWAEERAGGVNATDAGRQVRAEVEAETERLFFAAWLCLNESELEELSNLTEQLRDGFRSLNEQ